MKNNLPKEISISSMSNKKALGELKAGDEVNIRINGGYIKPYKVIIKSDYHLHLDKIDKL